MPIRFHGRGHISILQPFHIGLVGSWFAYRTRIIKSVLTAKQWMCMPFGFKILNWQGKAGLFACRLRLGLKKIFTHSYAKSVCCNCCCLNPKGRMLYNGMKQSRFVQLRVIGWISSENVKNKQYLRLFIRKFVLKLKHSYNLQYTLNNRHYW